MGIQQSSYEKWTELIVQGWERAVKYQTPWIVCPEWPQNPVTGTKYKGVNFLSTMSAGFESPFFYTYNQVKSLNPVIGQTDAQEEVDKLLQRHQKSGKGIGKSGKPLKSLQEEIDKILSDGPKPIYDNKVHVRAGEQGIPIFKYVETKKKNLDPTSPTYGQVEIDEETGKPKMVRVMAYAGTVFNESQIEGIAPFQKPERTVSLHDDGELMLAAIERKMGVKIIQGDRGEAWFNKSNNTIYLPKPELFKDDVHRYQTAAHEGGHATGPLLGRPMEGKFGSVSYSKEEIVAELIAVCVCAELGIGYNGQIHPNNMAYLQSWLKGAKEDPKFIYTAMKEASKGADMIINAMEELRLEFMLELEQKKAISQTVRTTSEHGMNVELHEASQKTFIQQEIARLPHSKNNTVAVQKHAVAQSSFDF